MADTDYYTFVSCQSYSPDILAADQTVCDLFGLSETENMKNLLKGILDTVPASPDVTDDMKAAVDYMVISKFKRHIKDYTAEASWLKDANSKIDGILKESEATPGTRQTVVAASSAYRSEPMKANNP